MRTTPPTNLQNNQKPTKEGYVKNTKWRWTYSFYSLYSKVSLCSAWFFEKPATAS